MQSPVTPPLRVVRARRDSETKSALSEDVFKTMSSEASNAVMLSLWESAYKRAGKKKLDKAQRQELLRLVGDHCGLPNLTFHALSQRVARMQDRGSLQRTPGSGRPRKFTEEHAEAAKDIARQFGGDISRSGIFELVAEKFGSENANKRSQFLRWLSELFKRRRIRYKPSLNDKQNNLRIAYAQHAVDSDFSDEDRTIFVDEKRFEANSPGIYNLPIEDNTPTRRVQSRSNPVFVMVLVAVVAPRGRWNGLIGTHFFTERVAAAKWSKNRDAGTMELHAVNVTKESYIAAWVKTIIPSILHAIREGNLPNPTREQASSSARRQCEASPWPMEGPSRRNSIHLCKGDGNGRVYGAKAARSARAVPGLESARYFHLSDSSHEVEALACARSCATNCSVQRKSKSKDRRPRWSIRTCCSTH
jgi:transposase